MTLLQTEVTRLVMHSLPKEPTPRPDIPRTLDVLKVRQIPLGYYRYLYRVGEAHHWTSRLLPDEALAREVHGSNTRIQVLYCDGAPAGWFELDAGRAPKETRLVHFAIMPEYRGLGLARHLLSHAIIAGFEEQPSALTVDTNTLDHPAALPLYRKMGFRPVTRHLVSTPAFAG